MTTPRQRESLMGILISHGSRHTSIVPPGDCSQSGVNCYHSLFMLTIRDEQRVVLRQGMRKQFVQRMVSGLRDHEPEASLAYDDAALLVLVQDAIDQAEGFGIRTRISVEIFIVAVLRLGRDFVSQPEHAQVRGVLEMQILNGQVKAKSLQAYLDTLPKD